VAAHYPWVPGWVTGGGQKVSHKYGCPAYLPPAQACNIDSPAFLRRMAWVAAYCLGPFGGNERTWKPFNPILGETFEVDKDNGVRFLAEQVPPPSPPPPSPTPNGPSIFKQSQLD